MNSLVPVDDNEAARDDGYSIQFGRCSVLPRSRQLLVDGVARGIGSRAFDLLLVLLEAHGRIVDRGEILARVWPKTIVSDISLRVQLASLRRALGDDRDLIKTIPGRGYLFAGDAVRGGGAVHQRTVAAPPSDLPPTNLHRLRHDLVGRGTDLAALREILPATRLVSLVGTGGIGKTQLAIALGWDLLPRYPGGVWLIDLSPVTDPALLASAVAAALGVGLANAGPAVDAILAQIGPRKRLLIFDNCEHLVDAAAALIESLLARSAALSVLATSQELLRSASELVYRVGPLAVPPPSAVEIGGFGAVALFVERAREADRRFTLHAGNVEGVAGICRGLDGVPLALEMAAARLLLLGVTGLRAALDARLKMLRTSAQLSDGRYLSLRAMLEWSHGLLDEAERRLFRRLALFAGSFSLDAVVTVAADEGEDRWDVVDGLGRLIEKSLVVIEPGDPPRYRLLETMRLFAAEQLDAAGEYPRIRQRHMQFFAALFEAADAAWRSTPDAQWLALYRSDIDNLRTALDWMLTDPAFDADSVGLAGSAGALWHTMGLFAEGRSYLDRAIERIGDATPPAAAARLLSKAGSLWRDSDRVRGTALLERATSMFRQLDDPLALASALAALSSAYSLTGRYDEAQAALDEIEPIATSGTHDNKKLRFLVLSSLGAHAFSRGHIEDGRRYKLAALAVAREMKDLTRECHTLMALAETEFDAGEADRAIELGQAAVAGLRQGFARFLLSVALSNLGAYLVLSSRLAEARDAAAEALAMERDVGGYPLRVIVLQWALIAALEGDFRTAARVKGFIDAATAAAGDVHQPTEQRICDRLSDRLAARLDPGALAACLAEGAPWSEGQAVRFVLDRIVTSGAAHN